MNPAQMQKMMKEAQKLQATLEKEQQELSRKEYTHTVGGGAITIVMNGAKKLISSNIKEEIIEPEEKEFIEDMIISGINATIDMIDVESDEVIGALTKGLPF